MGISDALLYVRKRNVIFCEMDRPIGMETLISHTHDYIPFQGGPTHVPRWGEFVEWIGHGRVRRFHITGRLAPLNKQRSIISGYHLYVRTRKCLHNVQSAINGDMYDGIHVDVLIPPDGRRQPQPRRINHHFVAD